MQEKAKAYSISLLIHLLFFLAYLILFKQALKSPKVVEIDLSLLPSAEYKEEKRQDLKPLHHTQPAKPLEKPKELKEAPQKEKTRELSTSQTKPEVSSESLPVEKKTAQVSPLQESIPTKPTEKASEGNKQEPAVRSFESGKVQRPEESASQSQAPQTLATQKEAFLKEKLSVISAIVQRNISYPPLARKMGWEGKVVVCFVLLPDGRLENLHILESSGYEVLDRNALEAVRKSAHLFPKPPIEVLVKLPVNYRLE